MKTCNIGNNNHALLPLEIMLLKLARNDDENIRRSIIRKDTYTLNTRNVMEYNGLIKVTIPYSLNKDSNVKQRDLILEGNIRIRDPSLCDLTNLIWRSYHKLLKTQCLMNQ